jgi:prophage antirepressor-like protein
MQKKSKAIIYQMSDNFFLDVFNKLLKINDESIMIIFDVDGNIWFKFRDLLKAFGYTGSLKHTNYIKISSIFKKQYDIIKLPQNTTVPSNFQKTTIFINEPGLYELLSQSTKPLAKVFMNKYYTEIM